MAAESSCPPLPAVPSAPGAGAAGSDTSGGRPPRPGPALLPLPAPHGGTGFGFSAAAHVTFPPAAAAASLAPFVLAGRGPRPRPPLSPRPARRPRGQRGALPTPPVLVRTADLEQELDPLDGRHRSLADGGGDAARQKVLEEGDGLVRHVRAAPEPPGGKRCCRSSRKGGSGPAHGLNAGPRRPRPRAPLASPPRGRGFRRKGPSRAPPLALRPAASPVSQRRVARAGPARHRHRPRPGSAPPPAPPPARHRHRPGPAPAGQSAGLPLPTPLSPPRSPSQALSAIALCRCQ